MAGMSVGVGIAALGILIGFHGPKEFVKDGVTFFKKTASRSYIYAALGLGLACLLSLIVANLWPLGFGQNFVQVHFLRDMAKAWYLFWPLALAIAINRLSSEQQRTLARVWIIAFGAFSALAVLQYFIGWPRPQMIPGNEPRYHATLFLGHHLSFASVFIFPFFSCLDLLARREGTAWIKLPKIVLALFSVFGLCALFMTFSRTLWVALPLGLLIYGIWAMPKRFKVSAAVLFFLIASILTQFPSIEKRLNDPMGIGPRKTLWIVNLEFLKSRPLTGVGWHHNLDLLSYYVNWALPQASHFVGHAHNNLIEMLASTGLIGALSWLVFNLIWIGLILKSIPQGFSKGLLCAWIVFQLNGLTQVNFWESKVMHQMAWTIAWILIWSKSESTTQSGVRLT